MGQSQGVLRRARRPHASCACTHAKPGLASRGFRASLLGRPKNCRNRYLACVPNHRPQGTDDFPSNPAHQPCRPPGHREVPRGLCIAGICKRQIPRPYKCAIRSLAINSRCPVLTGPWLCLCLFGWEFQGWRWLAAACFTPTVASEWEIKQNSATVLDCVHQELGVTTALVCRRSWLNSSASRRTCLQIWTRSAAGNLVTARLSLAQIEAG